MTATCYELQSVERLLGDDHPPRATFPLGPFAILLRRWHLARRNGRRFWRKTDGDFTKDAAIYRDDELFLQR